MVEMVLCLAVELSGLSLVASYRLACHCIRQLWRELGRERALAHCPCGLGGEWLHRHLLLKTCGQRFRTSPTPLRSSPGRRPVNDAAQP